MGDGEGLNGSWRPLVENCALASLGVISRSDPYSMALRIQAVYQDMKLGHWGSSWGASNSLPLIVKRGHRRDSRKVRPLCHVWAFYRSQRNRFEETAHWALRVGKVSIRWEVI